MKHFQGGTLKKAMALEVKRVLKKHRHSSRPIIAASLELGVHHKTLRVWLKEWEELKPTTKEMIEIMGEIFNGEY